MYPHNVVGTLLHCWVETLYNESDYESLVELLTKAGITNLRDSPPWKMVESKRGVFDFRFHDLLARMSKKYKVNVTTSLLETPAWAAELAGHSITQSPPAHFYPGNLPPRPEDFGAYVEAISQRYKGCFSEYEIWNEPSGGSGFFAGGPDDYTAITRTAYKSIRKHDITPQVLISLSCGGLDYLEGCYACGIQGCFDAVAIHPYMASTNNEDMFRKYIRDVRRVLDTHGDQGKMIHITEIGMGIDTENVAETEIEKGIFLARAFVLWLSLKEECNLGKFITYNGYNHFPDKAGDHGMGLISFEKEPLPAYYILGELARLLGNAQYKGTLPLPVEEVEGHLFIADGQQVLVLWSKMIDSSLSTSHRVTIEGTSRCEVLTVNSHGFDRHSAWQGQAIGITRFPLIIISDDPCVSVNLISTHPQLYSPPIPLERHPRPVIKVNRIDVPLTLDQEFSFWKGEHFASEMNDMRYAWRIPLEKHWSCPEDFQAGISSWYGDHYLYLGVEAWDRTPIWRGDVSNMSVTEGALLGSEIATAWCGDIFSTFYQPYTLHLGFSPVPEAPLAEQEMKMVQFAFAIGQDGTKVGRWIPIYTRAATTASAKVTVIDHHIHYKIIIPIREIGLELPLNDKQIGFTWMVNYSHSGDGPKGYLLWTRGLQVPKDPTLFGRMLFQ